MLKTKCSVLLKHFVFIYRNKSFSYVGTKCFSTKKQKGAIVPDVSHRVPVCYNKQREDESKSISEGKSKSKNSIPSLLFAYL